MDVYDLLVTEDLDPLSATLSLGWLGRVDT